MQLWLKRQQEVLNRTNNSIELNTSEQQCEALWSTGNGAVEVILL